MNKRVHFTILSPLGTDVVECDWAGVEITNGANADTTSGNVEIKSLKEVDDTFSIE